MPFSFFVLLGFLTSAHAASGPLQCHANWDLGRDGKGEKTVEPGDEFRFPAGPKLVVRLQSTTKQTSLRLEQDYPEGILAYDLKCSAELHCEGFRTNHFRNTEKIDRFTFENQTTVTARIGAREVFRVSSEAGHRHFEFTAYTREDGTRSGLALDCHE